MRDVEENIAKADTVSPDMQPKTIELRITDHVKHANKWDRDFYGDRYLNADYGTSYKYRHAKFRLPPSSKYPKGKPKCEIFGGDTTDEQVLESVSKKYQNLKMKFTLTPKS